MMQDEWSKREILKDDPNEAPVSVAELLNEEWEELEQGDIDDWSVVSSAASQKCTELVLDTLGRSAMGRNLLVDFQLVDYERRNDPQPTDASFKGFTYGRPMFLPREYVEWYPQGAD